VPARRGSIQIRFEILEHLYYSPRPQPRTHVWRKATTLSYDDFQRHLEYLTSKSFIEENEEGCIITKEGRIVYEKLQESLRSLL
jgi:predicted transcriptional regulator